MTNMPTKAVTSPVVAMESEEMQRLPWRARLRNIPYRIREWWYKRVVKQISEEQELHKQWYEEAGKMRLWKLPWFLFKLAFLYGHDYGTICHALAASALAGAHAMNHTPMGHITGFQWGGVLWEFITKWTHLEGPARLLKYEEMLYPQHCDRFTEVGESTWEWLRDEAMKKIDEHSAPGSRVSPHVMAHWKSIVDGKIPFGYALEPSSETRLYRMIEVREA